jgi:tetratricopeptide (TPR) repeat protein
VFADAEGPSSSLKAEPSAAAVAAVADAAHRAILLAQTDPRRAMEVAGHARRHAAGDAETTSRAERALGLAAKELNDLDGAVVHLRRAAAVARRAGLAVPEAEARMSLALTLAYRGQTAAALRQADLATPALEGRDAARLQMQRAVILARLGRQDEALDGYRKALAVFRQVGDALWEARVLSNRGVLHGYRSELAAARSDLQRALELGELLGLQHLVGAVCQNLGFVETRAGDIPCALAWYDRAEALWRSLEVPCAVLMLDRGDALLSVGLYGEGRAAISAAVAELAGGQMAADLAEARLMLAQAALLEGDYACALEAAGLAERAFARQQRGPWAVLARYVGARARWLAGERTAASLAAARRLADELTLAGWAIAALDARLMAGRIALELGRTDAARSELARASRARQRGPVDVRVRAWHAEGLLRLAEGDRRAADRALQAGVRLVHHYRHALGATELRAHSASHGIELAALGVRLAVEEGRPERVLTWAERARAGRLIGRPARPPDDAVLMSELAELRQVASELQEAVGEGRPAARLLRRQADLEDAVRRQARTSALRQASTGAGHRRHRPLDPGEPPSVDALRAQLGDSILIELVDVDGVLRAVAIGGGPPFLATLCPTAEAAAEVDSLRFALRRLATGHGRPDSLRAAEALLDHAARRLECLILQPVPGGLGDRPLVMVPTGSLHALPWAALPGLAGRPVTVAPSAALWLAAASAKPNSDRVSATGVAAAGAVGAGVQVAGAAGAAKAAGVPAIALVAGPDLAGARAEVRDLAARYRDAQVITGAGATVAAVTAAVDGADMAHIAAHGTFRADNPLFSCLTLADGALTVYDLERLAIAPRRMVLSSCDAGLSAVRPGDAVMGLAAAVLGLGTETLVASVAPVPDEGAGMLMAALHAELAAGVGPAMALAGAAASLDPGDHRMHAVRAGFGCFGSG